MYRNLNPECQTIPVQREIDSGREASSLRMVESPPHTRPQGSYSWTIHLVIERCLGAQPRSAVARFPRTRLLEPSENVAFSRPQTAIACSAGQDCGTPRSKRFAIALTTSPNASSPLSTYIKLRAGAFLMANA